MSHARKRKCELNLKEESQLPAKFSQRNGRIAPARVNDSNGRNWSDLEANDALKSNDKSKWLSRESSHRKNGAQKDGGINEDTRGRTADKSGRVRESRSFALKSNDSSKWPAWESLKNSGAQKDGGTKEDTRGWAADTSIRKSPPFAWKSNDNSECTPWESGTSSAQKDGGINEDTRGRAADNSVRKSPSFAWKSNDNSECTPWESGTSGAQKDGGINKDMIGRAADNSVRKSPSCALKSNDNSECTPWESCKSSARNDGGINEDTRGRAADNSVRKSPSCALKSNDNSECIPWESCTSSAHNDGGINKDTRGRDAECSVKKSPSVALKSNDNSKCNPWESFPGRSSAKKDGDINDSSKWPSWESSQRSSAQNDGVIDKDTIGQAADNCGWKSPSLALKSNDKSKCTPWESFPGRGSAQKDGVINEGTRRWAADKSSSVWESRSFDERGQHNKNSSLKKSWEQSGRGRSETWGRGRSQTPKWDSIEHSEISRNGSGGLSPPHRYFAAGQLRRGSEYRRFHQDDLNYRDWGSEIDLAESGGSRQDFGRVLRGGNRNRSQSRSQSPRQRLVRNSRRESYGWSDRSSSESRESSQPCINFAAGRCRRGHQCRFLHQSDLVYMDRRHSEIDPTESWGSRYGRGFRYDDDDDDEVYRDYSRDNASRGYTSSYDGGRNEPLKNSSRSSAICKDFLNGKCQRGSSCKYVHCASGVEYDRSIRKAPFAHDLKHERDISGKTLCKYFAAGRCREGVNCRFSHDSPAQNNANIQSNYDRRDNNKDDKNRVWKGRMWDDTTVVLDTARSTGQGDSDARNLKSTSAMDLKDSICNRRGHSLNDASGDALDKSHSKASFDNPKREPNCSDDTLCKHFAMGKCRDGDLCRFSHGDARKKHKDRCQDVGRNHDSDDKGRTWDDTTVVLDTARSTGQGDSDARNLKSTSAMDLKDSICNRRGHTTVVLDTARSTGQGDSDARNLKSTSAMDLKDSICNRRGHSLNDASGDALDKSHSKASFDHPKREPNCSDDTLCKHFAMGKCRDGDLCRFSHGGPARKKHKDRFQDVGRNHDSDDKKKLWNGSRWNDITDVSEASKCPGWGSNDVGKVKCTDAMVAEKCKTYYKPGHNLSDACGNEHESSNRNAPFDHNHEPEPHKSSGNLCRHFSIGKCHDGDHCRFSHDGQALCKPKGQSQADRWGRNKDDEKKSCNGLRMDETTAVSGTAKLIGRGTSDKFTDDLTADSTFNRQGHGLDDKNRSCGSPVLKVKAAERGEDQSSVLAIGSGAAIMGFPESMAATKLSVKKEPHSASRDSQSQNLNGTYMPFERDVMREASVQQLAVASIHPTVSESSTVRQRFSKSEDNDALEASNSQTKNMLHKVVVTRQSFELDISTGSLPFANSASFVAASKTVQLKPTSLSKEWYDSACDNTINLPPSNFSSCTEQQNQLPMGTDSVEIPNKGSSEEEYHESSKLKEQKPIANSEMKANSRALPNECKQEQGGGHLKNVKADGKVEEGNRSKDEKEMQNFKNALVEFIKEILMPTWKEGRISKDTYKTIVKKVVDKVSGAIQDVHIPKTRENIDHYLSFNRPNITKLVQDYVRIYPKN